MWFHMESPSQHVFEPAVMLISEQDMIESEQLVVITDNHCYISVAWRAACLIACLAGRAKV